MTHVFLFSVAPKSGQNGRQLPSVEVNMPTEEGSDVQLDCLERTCDGKYKCSYCNYANKGIARLIEHIRTHTGITSPQTKPSATPLHLVTVQVSQCLEYLLGVQFENADKRLTQICDSFVLQIFARVKKWKDWAFLSTNYFVLFFFKWVTSWWTIMKTQMSVAVK